MWVTLLCAALLPWEPAPRLSDLDRFWGDSDYWRREYDVTNTEAARLIREGTDCGRKEWRGYQTYLAADLRREVCWSLQRGKDPALDDFTRREHLKNVRSKLDQIDYLCGRVP